MGMALHARGERARGNQGGKGGKNHGRDWHQPGNERLRIVKVLARGGEVGYGFVFWLEPANNL